MKTQPLQDFFIIGFCQVINSDIKWFKKKKHFLVAFHGRFHYLIREFISKRGGLTSLVYVPTSLFSTIKPKCNLLPTEKTSGTSLLVF